MPNYLVESYLADSAAAVEQARERARRAAELGEGVRYIRTTFLPEDETVLHVFEARSLEALTHAGRLAELPIDRIVEAVEGDWSAQGASEDDLIEASDGSGA
jgi:hypothetical protein